MNVSMANNSQAGLKEVMGYCYGQVNAGLLKTTGSWLDLSYP